MSKASMPNKYWFYSFAVAVFLINRMPTPILNGLSPWQKLFSSIPDYADLKVFGCSCYPLLRPYNSNKLQHRTKQCVFMGYPLDYKGYCCLDLSTNKFFISRHVVFDEQVFPFAAVPHTTSPSSISSWFPSTIHPLLVPSLLGPIPTFTQTTVSTN